MVRLSLRTKGNAALKLSSRGDAVLTLESGVTVVDNRWPDYAGETEVIPTAEGLTLPTRRTSVASDIDVLPIPYVETSNDAGGYTVSIAS